jgi:hypothetical protein
MAQKHKILLVGGMDYNVPPELKDVFDVVKHVTQGSKFQSLPQADYVFIITEWAGHNLVEMVKQKVSAPIIPLVRGGWKAIKMDLQRRSILPPDEKPADTHAVVEDPEMPAADSLFVSMSEAEVWKKYGQALIEAAQGTLKPKEIVSEDDILEALSLSGVPKGDCSVFLPKLQLKGILDPCGEGRWRLMAAPGTDFDNERADPAAEADARSNGSGNVTVTRRRLRPPVLIALMRGLPKGPYASKRSIVEEMRKYVEFDAVSDWTVRRYIDRAIGEKIIDDSRADLYVNQSTDVVLTRKKELELKVELKAPDEILKEAAKSQTVLPFPTPKTIDKMEAEKAWCHVVENVRRDKDRLGNLLSHCRIEWMGDNHVLVIFLPSVLAQWMKFVESTENWGFVSAAVQERFLPNTAIRFMLDNGLRV